MLLSSRRAWGSVTGLDMSDPAYLMETHFVSFAVALRLFCLELATQGLLEGSDEYPAVVETYSPAYHGKAFAEVTVLELYFRGISFGFSEGDVAKF